MLCSYWLSGHSRKLRCAWTRVRFPVQGSICVADILPNSPGWLSTYLKVLGTVHKVVTYLVMAGDPAGNKQPKATSFAGLSILVS